MVRGVVVGFCSGKGIKIVNGHKKKCCCEGPAEGQFPCGHMMPAESSTALAPCNRLYELWGLMYKWCYFECHYVALRLGPAAPGCWL